MRDTQVVRHRTHHQCTTGSVQTLGIRRNGNQQGRSEISQILHSCFVFVMSRCVDNGNVGNSATKAAKFTTATRFVGLKFHLLNQPGLADRIHDRGLFVHPYTFRRVRLCEFSISPSERKLFFSLFLISSGLGFGLSNTQRKKNLSSVRKLFRFTLKAPLRTINPTYWQE